MTYGYGPQVSYREAREEIRCGLVEASAGGAVVATGMALDAALELPDKIDIILVGGGAGLAVVGLYQAVKGYAHLREARHWR